MPRIVVSHTRLLIDGRPALIQAGAVHYARLPSPDLWQPVLDRCRVAGLNAVFVPFPWAYHSPAPGFHDFTGPRDVRALLDATVCSGLWLIPHIGPWLGMGLDGGGVPGWLHRSPDAPRFHGAAAAALPYRRFLHLVTTWWEQLLPLLLSQPNLLALALDPGVSAVGDPLVAYGPPLLEVARRLGVDCPVALPAACAAADSLARDDAVLSWSVVRPADPEGQPPVVGLASPASSPMVVLDLALPLGRGGPRLTDVNRTADADHPRPWVSRAVAAGPAVLVHDPIHVGVNWDHWAAPGARTTTGYGAPLAELATPTAIYRNLRRLAMTLETVAPLLLSGPAPEMGRPSRPGDDDWLWGDDPAPPVQPRRPLPPVWADPPQALAWTRRTDDGAVAALTGQGGETFVQLALGDGGDDDIVVEDIPLAAGEVRILPLDWALFDGRLLSTTMEPVLHTVVAGRELIILRNDLGGEVVLPADFRRRHTRGPIYIERVPTGPGQDALALHFDPAAIASVVLEGPERRALQILALAPERAARVWPLDDAWRTTPAYPATWSPVEEAPARGVVIGPDLVIPEEDGAFRFLATEKGFGYRWGPWRGSDPQTWLSPFTWTGAPSIRLPDLMWESMPGSPEALPAYDDGAWRTVVPGSDLSSETLGIDAGFIWYRAYFDGAADAVTLACRHACDLFLNGEHIASISPPPDYGDVAPKTLPLPARHQGDANVLALLVEHQGRQPGWDDGATKHGLVACDLVGNVVRAWRVRGGLGAELQRQGFHGFADWSLAAGEGGSIERRPLSGAEAAVTWHRATFSLSLPSDVALPVFLFLDQTPTQCYIYLNGYLVGQIWYPRRPERRVWLPEGLLRRDRPNEVLVAQWTRGAGPGIGTARLEAGTAAVWHHESAV